MIDQLALDLLAIDIVEIWMLALVGHHLHTSIVISASGRANWANTGFSDGSRAALGAIDIGHEAKRYRTMIQGSLSGQPMTKGQRLPSFRDWRNSHNPYTTALKKAALLQNDARTEKIGPCDMALCRGHCLS